MADAQPGWLGRPVPEYVSDFVPMKQTMVNLHVIQLTRDKGRYHAQ
jgi:hypothetical protein